MKLIRSQFHFLDLIDELVDCRKSVYIILLILLIVHFNPIFKALILVFLSFFPFIPEFLEASAIDNFFTADYSPDRIFEYILLIIVFLNALALLEAPYHNLEVCYRRITHIYVDFIINIFSTEKQKSLRNKKDMFNIGSHVNGLKVCMFNEGQGYGLWLKRIPNVDETINFSTFIEDYDLYNWVNFPDILEKIKVSKVFNTHHGNRYQVECNIYLESKMIKKYFLRWCHDMKDSDERMAEDSVNYKVKTKFLMGPLKGNFASHLSEDNLFQFFHSPLFVRYLYKAELEDSLGIEATSKSSITFATESENLNDSNLHKPMATWADFLILIGIPIVVVIYLIIYPDFLYSLMIKIFSTT